MHRTFKNSSDFGAEFQKIAQKYLEVGYPISFIQLVINVFKNSKEEEQLIIPDGYLIKERKFCLSCLIVPAMKEMLSGLLIKLKVLPMEN